ncbi:DNA ligase D [Marinobacter salicampi]|uniref:DNA ligase D n=1 Tax=Marinobacter salicampi TaxID=435907 RepID=UPI001409C207|nr:DNA ligase D [Marinobacter salicampi]
MTDKLKEYRRKRNFDSTSEPSGSDNVEDQVKDHVQAGDSLYVMHMHAASHDHFDLRLEQDGVLRSWALPKGPSLKPGERRLAMEVEDHPLEYGKFEGVIPKGEYGGGTSMLWDTGRWRLIGKNRKDKLDFELEGKKLSGKWTLVKMAPKASGRKKDDNSWLLIKRKDDDNRTLNPDDRSVVSGRTMEEIAEDRDSVWQNGEAHNKPRVPEAAKIEKASKKTLPKDQAPQLATLVDEAPAGNDWVHEIKFDGYRLLARLESGRVTIYTRNGKDWTDRFPDQVKMLEQLPVKKALIDGELVAFDADGSSSFRKLQDRLSTKKGARKTDDLVYQVFDLLYLDGYDLRSTPLLERKRALKQLLEAGPDLSSMVRYSDHIEGGGKAFFNQVCELGLEGMISKRSDAAYRAGRNRGWLKTKCIHQDEFVVGGFTAPSGSRTGFGSLLLGAFGKKGLVYAGKVGSGFTTRQLNQIYERLSKLETSSSPFEDKVPDQASARWVKPELVVDVEFTERTGSGALRHPVCRGIREDKEPEEVQAGDATGTGSASVSKDETQPRRSKGGSPMIAGVELTNADRVMYPEQGITKLDLARYYEDIQDWILPHLRDRPLALLRCPEGRDTECFFQKHPGKTFAKGVSRVPVEEKKGGTSEFTYIDTISDIIELVQFGVLEFHPWGSKIKNVDKPDMVIFDLDPGPDVPWRLIADTAFVLRDKLEELGFTGFTQATGGKGLHVVVPIKTTVDWDTAKAFAHEVSKALAQENPKQLTTNMSKAKRQGRVFLDYLRNGRGNTHVASYSVRAREGAPVATPLRWDELKSVSKGDRYTVANIRRRLKALKEDPWQGFDKARAGITANVRKKLGME